MQGIHSTDNEKVDLLGLFIFFGQTLNGISLPVKYLQCAEIIILLESEEIE